MHGSLSTEPLADGRMGGQVTRCTTISARGERRSFVRKVVRATPWRTRLGIDDIEARLWLSGVTRALPSGLRCPTFDVLQYATDDAWCLLMDDVSRGIIPRGVHDQRCADMLMRNIARLHARYWNRDEELAALSLPSFEPTADAFADLVVHVARGGAAEPWLTGLAEDFWVCRTLLPVFLDALPAADADFYIELCREHARISAALAEHPRTLIHGDLRRANIAFVDDEVVLFDWERAARGPAARDLQWYWFLSEWAYPAAGSRTSIDRRGGVQIYLAELERELGTAIDRAQFDAGCELAWLTMLCQLGFCLADPLADAASSADDIARAKQTIAEAMRLARRLHDRHLR